MHHHHHPGIRHAPLYTVTSLEQLAECFDRNAVHAQAHANLWPRKAKYQTMADTWREAASFVRHCTMEETGDARSAPTTIMRR